jgi:hypothetical protein
MSCEKCSDTELCLNCQTLIWQEMKKQQLETCHDDNCFRCANGENFYHVNAHGEVPEFIITRIETDYGQRFVDCCVTIPGELSPDTLKQLRKNLEAMVELLKSKGY